MFTVSFLFFASTKSVLSVRFMTEANIGPVEMIRQHPTVSFFVFAFLISLTGWLIAPTLIPLSAPCSSFVSQVGSFGLRVCAASCKLQLGKQPVWRQQCVDIDGADDCFHRNRCSLRQDVPKSHELHEPKTAESRNTTRGIRNSSSIRHSTKAT